MVCISLILWSKHLWLSSSDSYNRILVDSIRGFARQAISEGLARSSSTHCGLSMVILASCSGVSSWEASMFGERGGRFFSLASESVPDAVAIISSVFIGVNFHSPLPLFALYIIACSPTPKRLQRLLGNARIVMHDKYSPTRRVPTIPLIPRHAYAASASGDRCFHVHRS